MLGFLYLLLVGLVAAFIDSSLGMGYGVSSVRNPRRNMDNTSFSQKLATCKK